MAFYDDSKGTNVGAVVAALDGFPRKVVLIAGGRDKGGSYAPLAEALARVGRAAVVIGEAADRIESALAPVLPVVRAATHGGGGGPRRRPGPPRRRRGAVSRVRELRHVPQLRPPRRGVRGSGGFACGGGP